MINIINPYRFAAPSGWDIDISTLTYNSVFLYTYGQDNDGSLQTLAFNDDGTKLYTGGSQFDAVFQYTLSTPWVVSSGTYDSVTFGVSSQDTAIKDIVFSDDGAKMFMLGGLNRRIFEYTLSTPWNLATASYSDDSYSLSSQLTNPVAFSFNSDGTKVYVADTSGGVVYQYSASTPWSVLSLSYDSVSFDFSTQAASITGIEFNDSGNKLLIISLGVIYQYTLSSNWDISSSSYDNKSFSTTTQTANPNGLSVNNDGTKVYVSDGGTLNIFQYDI